MKKQSKLTLQQIDDESLDRGPTPPTQAKGDWEEIAKYEKMWPELFGKKDKPTP